MTRHHLAVPVAGALIALAGCGGDAEKQAATTATTAPGSASLYGSYERRVTAGDIKRTANLRDESAAEQAAPKPSVVRMVIAQRDPTPSLTTTDTHDGLAIAMSIDAAPDGQLTIGSYLDPAKGAFCGPHVEQGADYSWNVEGRSLTLRAVKDPCADRDSTLTGRWTRR
jgi:hypothetical protein